MQKSISQNKKIRIFALFNIVLIASIVTVWFVPAVRSVLDTAESLNFLETRYILLTRTTLAHESNLQEIEYMDQTSRLLTYCQVAPTISDVINLIDAYDLQKLNFFIDETIKFDTYAFEGFMERRILMESMGTVGDSVRFLQQLQKMPITITDMTINYGENTSMNIGLRILFSG